jgi:hypothetical protein
MALPENEFDPDTLNVYRAYRALDLLHGALHAPGPTSHMHEITGGNFLPDFRHGKYTGPSSPEF